jgi:uncharacterized membrane protein (UPF0127 family)
MIDSTDNTGGRDSRAGATHGARRFPLPMRSVLLFALLSSMILWPGFLAAIETTTISVGGVRLAVEVADDPLERSLGLMYRESLPEDRGMLFVYQDEQPRAFWMKNTTIPLSIAFADSNGTIIAIMDMVPDGGRTRYRSSGPAMYALEVNKGWFGRRGVNVGDRMVIPGSQQ